MFADGLRVEFTETAGFINRVRGGGSGMTPTISDRSIVVAAKDQVSCDLAGEAAILNMKNGVYYGLDPVGAESGT